MNHLSFHYFSQRFLEEMVRMPEVWIVNNWEVIQWMQRPTPMNLLSQFEPWKCKTQVWNTFFKFKDLIIDTAVDLLDSTGGSSLQYRQGMQTAVKGT